MAPEDDRQAAQNKSPEGKACRQPFGFRVIIFFQPDAITDKTDKMKACQPGQKQKKNNVGADHLRLFGTGNCGAKGHPQSRGRNV